MFKRSSFFAQAVLAIFQHTTFLKSLWQVGSTKRGVAQTQPIHFSIFGFGSNTLRELGHTKREHNPTNIETLLQTFGFGSNTLRELAHAKREHNQTNIPTSLQMLVFI